MPFSNAKNPAVDSAPDFLHAVIERAALTIQAQAGHPTATFDYFTHGEERTYCVRMEWPAAANAPRLVVFDARTSEFLCQTMQGDWMKLDPTKYRYVPPNGDDESERQEWRDEQDPKPAGRARR